MHIRIVRLSISLLLYIFFVQATDSRKNVTPPEEPRQPRVSGRIVKLYTGSRPEPVYCANEGFQADPDNCAVFYRCVKGANNRFTVFRFQCGPGTVYDPETEVCNFPRNTKRSECGGLFSPSTEKHNENEIAGAQQEIPSPISARPVYGEIQSQPSQATSKPQYTQQSKPVWMTTSASQAMPPKPTAGTPRKDGDACTNDGFMGDSENCRKFYRCVGNQRGGFIRYEFMCSDTTVWDDEVQSCNHPWAVRRSRCERGAPDSNSNPPNTNEPPTNSQSPNTVQQQLQINYGQKVTQTQTQISHGAVVQNQTQINYGDRENKGQNLAVQNQTQISHDSAVSQTQTQINHANNGVQTQLQIDHIKQSSQAQSQVYETTSRTTTASASIEEDELQQGYDNPQSSETQRPIDNDDGNNECSDSGFMGDKNDCKKFYRCVDNGRGGFIRYEFSCGEGTVWDSSIDACNHAWAVKDCGGKAPQNSPENSAGTTSTTTTTENYSQSSTSSPTEEDSDLDTGYGSQNQQQEQEQTSSSTTETPKSTTESAKPTQAPVDSSGNIVCQSSGFMGDSNDCTRFYRCVDNGNGGYTRYEFKCGEGTVWDPEIEACNHKWAVKKCGGHSDVNKEQSTSTTQSTVITTVTLVETTTQSDSPDTDYDTGYGPGSSSESESSSTTTSTTSSPQTGSNDDNKCNSSGFMGDNNDCKKFYRCVDNGKGSYTRYEFTCGEGTVWDSRIDACNHAWAVEKCGGDGDDVYKETTSSPRPTSSTQSEHFPTEPATDTPQTAQTTSAQKPSTSKPSSGNECTQEGFMGDRRDCKKFYRCVDNGKGGFTKHEFTCGEGTVWDLEITACNHPPPDGECKVTSTEGSSSSSTQSNQEDDELYTESSNDSTTSSTEKSSSTTASQNAQSSSDKCNSEGFYGDSRDCKKFYRCVDNGKGGYTKFDFTCGEGTVWDQEIQGCNHESSNPNCTRSSSTDTQSDRPQSETTNESSTISSNTEGQTSAETTKAPPSQSSGKCESEGFFANPNDCKKFYRCVDDGKGGYTKYDFSCGDGTVWVQEIQACDHEDSDNKCSTQGESSGTTESYEQQSTTSSTSSTTSSGSKPSQAPGTENDESQNEISDENPSSSDGEECTNEGFYPNKNDCKRFYRCVDNGKGGYTKYDFACGEGTAWDSDVQTCNHIGEVKSCQGSNSENNQQQNTQEDETQTSKTTTSTSTSGPATEGSKPANNDKCEQEGYYGNTQDCTKFYRCVDNGKGGFTKYDFDCGEGTIWDQDVTTCNHPQDVANPSCQQSNNSDSSTSSSSSTSSPSGSSTVSSSTSTTTESNSNSSDCSGTTQKSTNKDVNCTKEGYYPNPNDCKKFYRCVDWDGDGKRFSVYHFECGEGTIWDPALDTCNHEESVYPPRDCSGGGQSQGENVGGEETESATDESTTTEQSTTEHQTTTQESTEKTTSEQTTSEQTTTEHSTTSEQTTTQHTTEQTTTQHTTQQTTQQTTTEQTTTQQTTEQTEQQTTEKTTTQQTPEKTTTEITEEHTTQQSTTEQTTQESTTSESTTAQQTTSEQTTTEHETTEESTTQQSEATEQTTEHESTTQESTEGTTQESTTSNESESTVSTTSATENTTTESEQESTTEGGEETTESSSSEKECPETEDDQNLFVCPTSFKRHPKYCNMFYQCTEDDDTHDLQIATFRCPNDTIYDESQTKCVEEKKADKKCDGEIAQKRRFKRGDTVYKEPIVVTSERLKCPAAGHYPFEKQECSPAFLKCQKTKAGKLRGYVYQCPENHVYWSVSRRCEPKSYLRDCKRSYNIWNSRWEIPIERRNVAP